MSKMASIDIILKGNVKTMTVDIINSMLKNGWKMERKNKISFLPLNDDGMYDWKSENIQKDELIQIIQQKEIKKEVIGICFYWQDTNIGISMLVFSYNEISFNLDVNRMNLGMNMNVDITDVNWYLQRILPCFYCEYIERLSFTQD